MSASETYQSVKLIYKRYIAPNGSTHLSQLLADCSARFIHPGHRGHVHPHRAQGMTVGIGEIAGVHKAVVFDGIDVENPAMRGGRVAHGIDGLAAVAGQSQHHAARPLWRHGPAREGPPFGMGE